MDFEHEAVYGGPDGKPLKIEEITADFDKDGNPRIHLFATISSKLVNPKSVDDGSTPCDSARVYATINIGSDNDQTREIGLSHLGILSGAKLEDDGEAWLACLPGGEFHDKILAAEKAYFMARDYKGTIYWSLRFPRSRPAATSIADFKAAMRAKMLKAAAA